LYFEEKRKPNEMPIITGSSRLQISFSSLGICIKCDNEVRFSRQFSVSWILIFKAFVNQFKDKPKNNLHRKDNPISSKPLQEWWKFWIKRRPCFSGVGWIKSNGSSPATATKQLSITL